jgi:prepilin-type N-terminal cleavage/methylation domain-containing protein
MNRKAFTLIELLVVVAIIGILAAVGVVAYNGYTGAAKVAVAKSNHKSVIKWVTTELVKCDLDSSVSIFNGKITCSTIASKLSGNQQDAANEVGKQLERGFLSSSFNLKNPYGAYSEGINQRNYKSDTAVTRAGSGADRDLGYTIIESTTHPTTGKARLNIHTCNKLSCIDKWWNNTNDNVELHWIELQ